MRLNAAPTAGKSKVTKAKVINYLLHHEVDLPMNRRELMRLTLRDLLRQKICVETDSDRYFHSGAEMSAIDYMLRQPDCFFTRRELEQMYIADMRDEEERVRQRMRNATKPLFH